MGNMMWQADHLMCSSPLDNTVASTYIWAADGGCESYWSFIWDEDGVDMNLSHGAASVCANLEQKDIDEPYVILEPGDTFFIGGKSGREPVWKYCLPKVGQDRLQKWDLSKASRPASPDPDSQHSPSPSKASRIFVFNEGDGWDMLKGWIDENMNCDGCEKELDSHLVDRHHVLCSNSGELSLELLTRRSSQNRRWDREWEGGSVASVLRLGRFFLHHGNGICYWSINLGDRADSEFMQTCWTYMQERAREDGSTFSLKNWYKHNSQDAFAYLVTSTRRWDAPSVHQADRICGHFGLPHWWELRLESGLATVQLPMKPREGLIGLSISALLGIYLERRGLFRRWSKSRALFRRLDRDEHSHLQDVFNNAVLSSLQQSLVHIRR